jgi:maltooligosyltrehalose trehalohydrolase
LKRRHDMPFGAECRSDGSVRFRLWAPAARRVELCLDQMRPSADLALTQVDNGWFELITNETKPGSRYRFRVDGQPVPDPASRFQPFDVHGPSEVIVPDHFDWTDKDWQGRRWEEAVIYEFHVGTFTADGTFSAARQRLDYLADLGVTALEMMPVSDFPGRRNWGYDGVLPFAPDSTYGRPEDLKGLILSAHDRGIMVFLDVVYNHFGPEGNYLSSYAPQFFTERHHTPWGNGINFDGAESRVVRDFFINNALYWLNEYHFDGLRLDAVHAIADDSHPDILTELAETVRNAMPTGRHIHLILENDRNQARYLQRSACRPRAYTAQWNDDIHHALHTLITDERDGYYSDYSERPVDRLGRCLIAGFAFQGEQSPYRSGERRGEPTAGLPPGAFVSFLQNHDQIGNRAFGERIVTLANRRAVRAAMAILLLAPSPPLLFMGEEFGSESPFLFFCDFGKELAAAVTKGRRSEFERFGKFTDPVERERIPDPNADATFAASHLNWAAQEQPAHQAWLDFYRNLLKLRRRHVQSRITQCNIRGEYEAHEKCLTARWQFADNSKLTLLANLGTSDLSQPQPPTAEVIYMSEGLDYETLQHGVLPAWSVAWLLKS